MTATGSRAETARLEPGDVLRVTALLESDFGRLPAGQWAPRHHYLLDALDRRDHLAFVVWPEGDPLAVLYLGPLGTVVAAGDAGAGPLLGPVADRAGWRVLIGDAPITRAVLEASQPGWFRRRPHAREQRFMLADPARLPAVEPPPGFRPAAVRDVPMMADMACRLHVEDQMGPPVGGLARDAVHARMADSVRSGSSYVVERAGVAIAKFDLSLRSPRRGAQLAGVYVHREHRGQGIAASACAALCRRLFAEGLPAISLHVRSDNQPALRAYANAGFVDVGPWLLAIR